MAGALTADEQARAAYQGAATLTIDLGALVGNWRLLGDRAAPAECAAVVKADAYGIGIEPAVRALSGAGCRTFFVAHLGEAARARAAAPSTAVYVLNGLLPGSEALFLEIEARPVLGSFEELESWANASRAAGRPLPAALHVDTGMNRLGFPPGEAGALAADPRLRAIRPTLLMSHLCSAEEPGHPLNGRQRSTFAALREVFPDLPASLANSSGIFLPGAAHDMVRPGYALYGGNPQPGRPNPMRPVVRLEAPVIQTREVPAGAQVGYNATWTASRPSRLATLSLGYADGYPRAASATDGARAMEERRGAALLDGRVCPVAGRVSMDLIVVDVTDLPPDRVRRGDSATLIGGSLDLDEVGRRAGTIGYEILTRLGRRYRRSYVGS